jgi:3-hydroxy-9,10-secoandrosta-1,3,5(10)-triene-9,17-dione monooxygenase reductase component
VDEPGGHIHTEHPFATPADLRDPHRRLRGQLVAPVTIWTAGTEGEPVGLTVSSVLVAHGDPAAVIGLLDPDSDLWDRLAATGIGTVNVLGWRHRLLADVFAGLHPSPGGMFRSGHWEPTPHGLVLSDAIASVMIRVRDHRRVGWSVLVEAEVTGVDVQPSAELAGEEGPLAYLRGRYRRLAPVGGSGGSGSTR